MKMNRRVLAARLYELVDIPGWAIGGSTQSSSTVGALGYTRDACVALEGASSRAAADG